MTDTDRQLVLPAVSRSRTTTVFPQINNGTSAVQYVVPVAVPEFPVEVDQVTAVTPTLSVAVPVSLTLAELVRTLVLDGLVIFRAGATLSVGITRFTTTVRDADTEEESTAVRVSVLTPGSNGRDGMDQVRPPSAEPLPPRSLVQVTRTSPFPSVTIPESARAEAVVVTGNAGGDCTVSAGGSGGPPPGGSPEPGICSGTA